MHSKSGAGLAKLNYDHAIKRLFETTFMFDL